MTRVLVYINKESEVKCMAIGPEDALIFTKDEETFIKVAEDEIDSWLRRRYEGEGSISFVIEDSKRLAPFFEKVWREDLILTELVRRYSDLQKDGWSRVDSEKDEISEKHVITFVR